MKNRIIGIDVARALAIMGMIIVNFKIAFGDKGNEAAQLFVGILEGKASATFVILAGVGIAFMSNNAITNNDKLKLTKVRLKVFKRAVFLFFFGLLFIPIWLADILHFYGIYMLITLLVISCSQKTIVNLALLLILIYPFLMMVWNYDTGWNFETYEYSDLWSVSGFVRNLLFNGFHPVIPWTAFMLIGLWFGKQDLSNTRFIKKSILLSCIVYITILVTSKVLIAILSESNHITLLELEQILGTSPMPPLPVYMISAASISIFIISICIFVANKYQNNLIIVALTKTGQLVLTFYVAHIVIGMGVLESINPKKLGQYSIEFSIGYAFAFSILCVIFAMVWTKYIKTGPLEWLMRKLT